MSPDGNIASLRDALDATRCALEIVKRLQDTPIGGIDNASCRVTLACARSDLDFLLRTLEGQLPKEEASDMAIRLAKEHRIPEKSR